jgi:hypothetical protein
VNFSIGLHVKTLFTLATYYSSSDLHQHLHRCYIYCYYHKSLFALIKEDTGSNDFLSQPNVFLCPGYHLKKKNARWPYILCFSLSLFIYLVLPSISVWSPFFFFIEDPCHFVFTRKWHTRTRAHARTVMFLRLFFFFSFELLSCSSYTHFFFFFFLPI